MRNITVALAIAICLVALAVGRAQATDTLQAREFQVTFDANGHSTPMVGQDSISDVIVYSRYPVVNGVYGNASIYYQRVANGAPVGGEVAVTNSPQNNWLNDVSGDNIVYTQSPAVGALGNIVLYQISTGQSRNLTSTGNCWSPRIYGDVVVWIEVLADGSGQVVEYQISSGVPVQSKVVGGPIPLATMANVGDRFIVWSQLVNNQYDLAAYDMKNQVSFTVASDPQLHEMYPSTEGAWIAFVSAGTSSNTVTTIQAVNVDTGERRVVADNGANNLRPNISGNLISYESNVLGNAQIFVYRIDTGETFQVTDNTHDEHLNDLWGGLVTYIDNRNGNDGVFASALTFVSNSNAMRTPGYQPSGLAYDGTYLYVSEDSGFRRIYKLDPQTGTVKGSFLAPSPTGFDGNGNPNGLAYDGNNGHLFVIDVGTDSGGGIVYEIDTSGTTLYHSFNIPFRGGAIAFDGTYIYVSDFDSSTIRVVTRNGDFVREFDAPSIRPADMVFDPTTGYLFVIDELNTMVSKMTTSGGLLCQVDGPRNPGVQGLGGITIADSRLYIAEVSDPDPYNPPEIPGTIYIVPMFNCPPRS
jgi:hypothetical protein